jgi:hypothetical protein
MRTAAQSSHVRRLGYAVGLARFGAAAYFKFLGGLCHADGETHVTPPDDSI